MARPGAIRPRCTAAWTLLARDSRQVEVRGVLRDVYSSRQASNRHDPRLRVRDGRADSRTLVGPSRRGDTAFHWRGVQCWVAGRQKWIGFTGQDRAERANDRRVGVIL